MSESKMIIELDNFTKDPDAVRQSALNAGFGTWRPNKGEVGSSIYDGMCFWGDHAACLRPLSKALGVPVYPNDMFFRITNENTEGAYVHSDRESGDITCIVYLSKHDEESGTGFYRHKETGMIRMPSFAEMKQNPVMFTRLKRQMTDGPENPVWERYQFVKGTYNKALIFEAPLFHARHPVHGFGDNNEDGRMVWAAHFGI